MCVVLCLLRNVAKSLNMWGPVDLVVFCSVVVRMGGFGSSRW